MAHSKILKKDFSKLIERNRLSHSILLFGESFLAQYEFVHGLSRLLELGSWDKKEPLLDALFFDEQSASGIDAARSMSAFLWKKPFRSSRRMLVFHRADRLTTHAQNAILKIAEDPPEYALMVFTVKNPDVLISPLLSRLQKVFLSDVFNLDDEFIDESGKIEKKKVETYVHRLLNSVSQKDRSETIKELLSEEDSLFLNKCIAVMLSILKKDIRRNSGLIKEVLHRWTLMQEYNTNKKLQLEAMFTPLDLS